MKYETICSRLESKERKRAQLDTEIVQLRQMKLQMEHNEELARLRKLEKQTLSKEEAQAIQAEYNTEGEQK
ncbi:MAG: hypothetical protein MJ077_11500 [Oscillospiraceae bacterium]|nr:hypothetical protein [Oscillospiraceae bacterium]